MAMGKLSAIQPSNPEGLSSCSGTIATSSSVEEAVSTLTLRAFESDCGVSACNVLNADAPTVSLLAEMVATTLTLAAVTTREM